MPPEVRVIGLDGIPEIEEGDDLVGLIGDALDAGELTLEAEDVLVITQKVVSKSEGRLVDLKTIEPSPLAKMFADRWNKDARQVEVVLRESVRIVRMERGVMICETRHGFVCANAGVDASNVPHDETVCLLPLDSDASATKLRDGFAARYGVAPAVIISDSFGRPWRRGIVNVAIGLAGLETVTDYRGQTDPWGYDLRVTIMAVADELASAAELVHGKTDQRPAALIRGFQYTPGDGRVADLVLDAEKDLFR